MDVAKEIIRPGIYTYLNQSGQPERLTVTGETIKHFHDQGQAMLAANLSVPVPFEHQPDAKVMTAAERAAHQLKNNAGFVKKYEIRNIENEDRLFGILDIPDADIRKKLPTTIRSVSPWINSFTDGNGKRWDGVISHVALTTRPRITNQAPFESTGAAMSLIGGLADKVLSPASVGSGLALSSAGLLRKKGNAFKPEFPIAFSLFTGVKLSKEELDDMADDDDDVADDDSAEGSAPGKSDSGDPAATAMADDPAAPDMDESAGDVSFEELIPHLLEMHGIHIPAGGKGKEFLQALVQGLLASAKALATVDGGPDDNVLGDNPDPAADPNNPAANPAKGPIKQESPPMYMSLTAESVKKIKDPEKRQLAEISLSLQTEVAALRKNKIDEANTLRQRRIERVCKVVSAKNRDRILQTASSQSAQLSLGSDGVVRDPMATMLEIFEEELQGMPELLKKDAKFSEQPQPDDSGMLTDAQAEAMADQMTRRFRPAPSGAA